MKKLLRKINLIFKDFKNLLKEFSILTILILILLVIKSLLVRGVSIQYERLGEDNLYFVEYSGDTLEPIITKKYDNVTISRRYDLVFSEIVVEGETWHYEYYDFDVLCTPTFEETKFYGYIDIIYEDNDIDGIYISDKMFESVYNSDYNVIGKKYENDNLSIKIKGIYKERLYKNFLDSSYGITDDKLCFYFGKATLNSKLYSVNYKVNFNSKVSNSDVLEAESIVSNANAYVTSYTSEMSFYTELLSYVNAFFNSTIIITAIIILLLEIIYLLLNVTKRKNEFIMKNILGATKHMIYEEEIKSYLFVLITPIIFMVLLYLIINLIVYNVISYQLIDTYSLIVICVFAIMNLLLCFILPLFITNSKKLFKFS